MHIPFLLYLLSFIVTPYALYRKICVVMVLFIFSVLAIRYETTDINMAARIFVHCLWKFTI